uniref:Uncharacterized protein n=1 Tax=Rhizophora mucronata TaxID=61149 RepID=A0A2P2QTE6_RHIMU
MQFYLCTQPYLCLCREIVSVTKTFNFQ